MMTTSRFRPSTDRSWSRKAHDGRIVHSTGWAQDGGEVIREHTLGDRFLQCVDAAAFESTLRSIDGNFAVVLESPDHGVLCAGVDRIRSIPLLWRSTGDGPHISDDLRLLVDGSGGHIDPTAVVEFAMGGMVTGPRTLLSEVHALRSGDWVHWSPDHRGPAVDRYEEYLCRYDRSASRDELSGELTDRVEDVFAKLADEIGERQAVVPLSGGLDSRLVARSLWRAGLRDVLCFAYGVPGHPELQRSEKVAERLSFPWLAVEYRPEDWREALASQAMREYWELGCNGVSLPHVNDWIAVRRLRDEGRLREDAVFVPGHTGDFICGSHLKYLFDPAWNPVPGDLRAAILSKHLCFWYDRMETEEVRSVLESRLDATLTVPEPETLQETASQYERWEWQERQAKFIVNSVRSYETVGYAWRLPLWRRPIVDFWKRVPLELKLDKVLYKHYLVSTDEEGLFGDITVPEPRPPDRLLEGSNGGRVSRPRPGSLGWLAERWRRHLSIYRRHYLGMSRSYGLLRYVFRDPGKRHTEALLARRVLRQVYGTGIDEALDELRKGSACR